MSIELELLEACENCPDFKATTDTFSNTVLHGKEIYIHTVRCANYFKCQRLIEHLQKEVNKDGR